MPIDISSGGAPIQLSSGQINTIAIPLPVSSPTTGLNSLVSSHLNGLDGVGAHFIQAVVQPSSPQSRGVPPHLPHTAPAPMPFTAGRGAARSTSLQPESPSLADCLARRHDWSDLNLQCDLALNVREHRTPVQGELLATALEKIKAPVGSSFTGYWARQAAWSRYDSLASIISCSTYARREDFIHCGHTGFSCQDRLLCPRCCYNFLARRVEEEFGHGFGEDSEVYFIVISLSRDADEMHRLKFKDMGAEEYHDLKHRVVTNQHIIVPGGACDYGIGFDDYDLLQCRLLWHFYSEAIHEFTGNGRGSLFSGVVGGPELSVQLNPLRVLPHANYLCWSPGFTIDGARELRRFIRTKMRDCRHMEPGLYPSVACYRLCTADDLRRVIKYIFKPIDLASAYVRAAECVGYAPAALQALNQSVNSFLKNVLDVFWKLRRLSRYGRCHASHHDYIGEVSAYRLARRETAERRAGGRVKHGSDLDSVARWQLHHEQLYDRPQWPCSSRFQFLQQHGPSGPLPYAAN